MLNLKNVIDMVEVGMLITIYRVLMNQGMSEAQASAAIASMGLATAEGTATAATFSLSGALSGLWATLMANPLVLVAAGVSAAVMAISSYSNSMKEAMSSAREAGNSWSEENTSLEDNISRIQELREALASGTLTEQEAADAKSELLSIQESLTDSYGDQVEGIDLVNGSLEQQINLLEKISQKNADNFLNENKKSIDKATKEMEKSRHTYLGQFYDNGSEESEAIKKTVKDLQDKYGEEVFQLNKSSDGFTMDLHFNADAAEAEEALNDFMTEISDIEDKYGESDTLDLMSDNAYSGLKSAKDVLGEYQDLYDQAQKAEMISDDALYSADGKEQTAAKWLSDYAKAVEAYNDAVADGDDLKITEAADNFNTLDSAMKTLSKESGMSEYADQIQEVRDQLNDTAIANSKFTKAVKGNDSSTFGKKVAESAKALKDLNLSDTDFKYAFETDGVQEGEDAVNSLIDAALECGVISDTSSEQVSNLVSMLAELGIVSSTSGSAATEAVSGLEKQLEDTKTALSGINAATSLLDSQSTGKSITIDDFNSDDLADYTSALEYNNGALQLNAEKVRALQKAKAEEAIQTNDNLKQEKQTEYMQNIAEIEQLQEKLRGLSDAKSENAEKIQSNIDALLAENDGIVNQCNQLDLLSASLREATGAYQAWLDKDKTKDINALKAQIAALEGTTNAAAKAKLAKLKADLKDKEEDLADTKYEHQLDMESKGYDDLSEKADDALDNTLKSLKSNTDLQKSVINDMLSEVKDSYKETFGEISKILEEMGYQTSELFKDLMNVNTIKNSTNETVNDAKNHPGDYTNVDTSGVSSDSKANAAISGALKDSESAGNAANGIGYDQNGKPYNTTTGTGNNKKYVNQLSLSLNPKNVTVYEGKEKSVKVSYTNAFSDNLKNFTVTINDSTIATVQKINNSSFKITGKKTGRAVVSVHPVVSSAATVKLAVTVRRNTYGKHAKTVDAAINKSGYGFTAEERQSIKDSLIIGKSESALNNKKDFDAKTQEAIQKKLKEKLTTWYNSLKNKKFKPSDYQKKHALVQHFNQKGKDVPASKFVDVASILGMKYPNAYSKWTSKQKTNLLKKLQTFGFSKGGVVRNLIPADMGTMLGNAIIRNGDTGFIGARPGETVLTEEFTKLLKPSIASMNEFTDMMTGNNGSKLNNVPSVQNQNITFSPEINLNVDRIDSELDIKDLAHQLSGIMYDDFSTKMTKDWKKDMQKLTGRFR